MAVLNQKDWKKVNLRNVTKGVLEVETYTKRVYLWDEVENICINKMLTVSRKKDGKGQWECKYAFSNAKDNQFTINEWLICNVICFGLNIVLEKLNRMR